MADWSNTDFEEQAANPAQPAGLSQTASRFGAEQSRWAQGLDDEQAWLPPGGTYAEVAQQWWGGQNLEGTQNGWDTTFLRESKRQWMLYQDKAFESGNPADFFGWLDPAENPAATGVVLWDDEAKGQRRGDVWLNGVQRENLYDIYDQYDADLLMSAYMFDGREQARLNRDGPEAYRRAVEDRVAEYSGYAEHGEAAAEFREDVEEQKEEFLTSWGGALDDAGAFAAGAGGGAAIGASIGTFILPGLGTAAGALLGAGIGGVAGWLNRDQFTEVMARTSVVADRANQRHGMLTAGSEWLQGGGQLLMLGMSPLQNVWQGGYDAVSGDLGDGVADWYSVDGNGDRVRPAWMEAVNLAAAVGDGFLQFGRGHAATAYMVSMGGHSMGRLGSVLSSDSVFVDEQGGYDELEGWKERAAAYGSVAIDVTQLGVAGALSKAAASSRAVFGEERASTIQRVFTRTEQLGDRAWARLRSGRLADAGVDDITRLRAQTINGQRFFLDDELNVVTSRMTLQMVAPSEFMRWLPTGWRARSMTLSDNGMPDADDLYAAALQLTSGGSRWSDAVLNAYAEATEEAAQAWLDPMAHGSSASWGEIQSAAMYGGAGGLGMSLGTNMKRATNDQMRMQQAMVLEMRRTGVFEPDDAWYDGFRDRWKNMTEVDKRRMETADWKEQVEIRQVLETMAELHDTNWDSPVGMFAGQDMRKAAFLQSVRAVNDKVDITLQLLNRTSEALRLPDGSLDTQSYAANDAVMSAWQTQEVVKRIARGLADQRTSVERRVADLTEALAGASGQQAEDIRRQLQEADEQLADTIGAVDASARFSARLTALFDRYAEEVDNTRAMNLLDEMNGLLNSAWEKRYTDEAGSLLPPDQQEMVQRAVMMQTTRHPLQDTGSFSILKPQVSRELSRLNANGGVYTFQGVLAPLGGDTDGDNRVTLNMMYLPPAQRRARMRGTQYVVQVEDGADLLDMSQPRDRSWEVAIDPPTGEWRVIKGISTNASMQGNEGQVRRDIVLKRLGQLEDAFVDRYKSVLPPAAVQRAMQDFQQAVLANKPNARIDLLNALYNLQPNAAELLFSMSDDSGVPEVLWMSQRITSTWDSIQAELGARTFSRSSGRKGRKRRKNGAPVAPAEAYLEGRAVLEAANVGQLLSNLSTTTDPVRQAQGLNYMPFLRSAVESGGLEESGFTQARLIELASNYMLLASKESQSELEHIYGYNAIEQRVLYWLEKAAEQLDSPLPMPARMMTLAQVAVQDFEVLGPNDFKWREGTTTVLQMLLRQSLLIEENINRGMPADSDVMKRINKLKRYTHPQGPHSYSASEALVEVFGGFSLYDLVGDSSEFLGSQMTLAQLRKMTDGVHERTRAQLVAEWRDSPAHLEHGLGDPPYSAEVYRTGMINPYTMVVDALVAVRNTSLDRMETADKEIHAQVLKGFSTIQHWLRQWRKELGAEIKAELRKERGTNVELTDEVLLDVILETRPELARMIAEAIPEASRRGTFEHDKETGRTYTAQWVKEMLLAKSAERAAVIYLVHSHIDSFNQHGGKVQEAAEKGQNKNAAGTVRMPRLTSRFEQTMYMLASQPTDFELNRFLRTAQDAPTVEALFEAINNTPMWRGDRAKLLPWHDDVALFETDPKDVWTANLPGAIQREFLRGWADRLSVQGTAALQAVKNSERADNLIAAMAASREEQLRVERINEVRRANGEKPITGDSKVLDSEGSLLNLKLLEMAIENRLEIPDAIGGNARMQYIKAIQDGLLVMHNKGSADERVAPMGDATVFQNSFGLKSGLLQEMDSLSTYDFEDILTNPTKLVEGPTRITFDDGRWTIVDMSTVDGALKMLGNRLTRSLAIAVLFPTVRDVNTQNALQVYLDVDDPGDFQALLESQSHAAMFARGPEGRMSYTQAVRYIGMVEASIAKEAAGGSKEDQAAALYPIQSMINDILTAYSQREGWRAADKDGIARSLMVDVAQALQLVADLPTRKKRKELKRIITGVLEDRFENRDSDASFNQWLQSNSLVGTMLNSDWIEFQEEAALEETIHLENLLLDPNLSDAERRDINDRIDKILNDTTLASTLFTELLAPGNRSLKRAYELFKVDIGSKDEQVKKRMLTDFILWGDRINRFRGKEGAPIVEDLRALKADDNSVMLDDLQFDQGEWDQVTGWAMAVWIAETTARSGAQVPMMPIVLDENGILGDSPVNRYYDQTYAYLIDALFDDSVLRAADKVARQAKFSQSDSRTPSVMEAQEILLGGILAENKLGVWSEAVVTQSMKLRTTLETAAVGMSVAVAGSDPKLLADYVAMSMPTFVEPEPQHMSNIVIGGAKDQPVRELLGADPVQFVKLHNHFTKRIELRTVLATGAPGPVIDLSTIATSLDSTDDSVASSGYRVLNIDTLQQWLDRRLGQMPDVVSYELEIDYVDVDKKPAGPRFANSIYFDGVGRQNVGDASRGPLASIFFSLGGDSKVLQQEPLNAATKGGSAYLSYQESPRGTLQVIRSQSQSVTELMQNLALHLQQQRYENGARLADDLPGLYKFVKSRFLIVQKFPNGTRKVMRPEEVIELESRGSAPDFDKLEVLPLSDRQARSILGDNVGFKGTVGAMTAPQLNLQDSNSYPELTEERLARLGLAGIGRYVSPDNWGATPLAQVALPPKATLSDTKGAQRKSSYQERISRLMEDQVKVRTERASRPRSGVDFLRINELQSERLVNHVNAEGLGPVLQRLGIPFGMLRDESRQALAERLAQSLPKALLNQNNGVFWHYQQDGNYSLAEGLLTWSSLNSEPEGLKGIGPTYGDIVSIDLDSFFTKDDGTKNTKNEAFEQAKQVIRQLSAKGVTFAFISPSGAHQFRGRVTSWMNEGSLGYSAVSGSPAFYAPMTPDQEAFGDTLRSLQSTNLAVNTYSAKGLSIALATDFFPDLSEGTAYIDWDHDQAWRRAQIVVLPTNLLATDTTRKDVKFAFNEPSDNGPDDPSSKEAVRTRLLALRNSSDIRDRLKKQAGGVDGDPKNATIYKMHERTGVEEPGIRSYDEALDHLLDTLEAGEWPGKGSSKLMRQGDMYPTVDSDGNIVLIRVGFKMPGVDDLVEMFNKRDNPKVGVVKAELDQQWTFPLELRVDEVTPDPTKGLIIKGSWETKPGKSVHVGPGFKPGFTTMPEHIKIPDVGLGSNGMRPSRFISLSEVEKKNAFRGLSDNMRDALAIFGANFRYDLVTFFYGDDAHAMKPNEFENKWNDLQYLLKQWSEMDFGLSADDIEQGLDAGTWVLYAQDRLNELFSQGLQMVTIDPPDMSLGLSKDDVSARISTVILATLAAPNVKLHHVLGATGLVNLDVLTDQKTVEMPSLLVKALSDPNYKGVEKDLRERINSNLPRFTEGKHKGKPIYYLRGDWTFIANVEVEGKITSIPTQLQVVQSVPASENTQALLSAGIGADSQDATQHVTNVINAATGGRIELLKDKDDVTQLLDDTGIIRFDSTEKEQGDLFLTMMRRSIDPDYTPWAQMLPVEGQYLDRGWAKVKLYQRGISKKDWDASKKADADAVADKLIRRLGLDTWADSAEQMRHEVDYLVRQFLGRPGATKEQLDGKTYDDSIPVDVYKQAVDLIYSNVERFMNPLHGGVVPLPSRRFLELLYRSQRGREPSQRWAPRAKDMGRRKRSRQQSAAVLAIEWIDWVDSIFGHVRESNTEFSAMFLEDTDGFWQTYRNSNSALIGLGLSTDEARNLRLMDVESNRNILSINPMREALLRDPIIMDTARVTLDALTGHEQAPELGGARYAEVSALGEQLRRQKHWLAKNKVRKQQQQSMQEYLKNGTMYREKSKNSNFLMRNMVNLSLTMRLFNPALYTSGLIEVPVRNALEHFTNLLTGRQRGRTGKALSRAGEKLGMTPQYTPEQIDMVDRLAKQMGQSNAWLSVLYDEMTYQSLVVGAPDAAGATSRALERAASWTARATSDPRWGMRATSVAQRYLDAALETLALTNSNITLEQFVAGMTENPLWLQNQYESDDRENPVFNAHRAGMNRVAQVRSTKQTIINKILMGKLDSLAASDRASANIAGHLLKIPFMFTRFNVNALMTVTGLAGWDQAAAMFFDQRKKPNFLVREGGSDKFEMTDIIETMDLQRTFIRSGTTLTMLMALASMAGGLGGDDEEERRRERLAKNLNIPHYLDPREAANSFTYSDAIFLNSIPGLNLIYKDESGNSAVVPHWIIRQFTSPIIGMQRFFESGDLREISWGFLDAYSALPYSIPKLWNDADATAKLLAAQAVEESQNDTSEAQFRVMQTAINIVGVYEKALFENSFINTLRNGGDKYDRNPWLIPATTDTGEIEKQEGSGLPEQTDALQTWVDEDGNVRQSYATRKNMDGLLHQYAENNSTFALAASLFTGQFTNSSYLRQNMAPRQQTVRMPEMSPEQAEKYLLASYFSTGGQESLTQEEIIKLLKQRDEDAGIYWDQGEIEEEAAAIFAANSTEVGALSLLGPDGIEEMTAAGKESALHSIFNGTLDLDSPALRGFWMDQETRDAIGEKWTEELIQEGIDLGLGYEASVWRARRFWKGDADQPGLADILYDRRIPSTGNVKYNQLNVTYVIGPDGKPWATPFMRAKGLQSFLPLPSRTAPTTPGSTRLDSQGKIVDEVLGINTGLHALERELTESDIEKRDFPEHVAEKAYTSGAGGRRSGGYSGGGYFRDMRALPGGTGARMDSTPMINTSNPYIRRARVNRQRIWTDRGRLKEWQ